MFKIHKLLKGVEYFFSTDKTLLYITKNGNVYINEVEYKQNGLNFLGGYLDKDEIINLVTNEKVYWYRNEIQFQITKPLEGFIGFAINNYLRLFRNEKLEYCAYDISVNEIKQVFKLKFNGQYPAVYHNFNLIFHEFPHSILSSLSLLTGEKEWELDLSSFDRIVSVIGHSHGFIIVQLESEKAKHLFLGIETASGRLAWQFDLLDLPLATPKNGFISPNYKVHLDAEQGMLHFIGNIYATLDVQTQEGKLLVDYKDESYESFINVLHDGNAYCIGRNRALGNDGLGWWVFNTQTLKVEFELYPPEWQKDKVLTLNDIQVGNNKVYVLDSGNSMLYVYEKVSKQV